MSEIQFRRTTNARDGPMHPGNAIFFGLGSRTRVAVWNEHSKGTGPSALPLTSREVSALLADKMEGDGLRAQIRDRGVQCVLEWP